MAKLYIFSRLIHRYLVLIISILTLIMAGTGVVLKYKFLADIWKIDSRLTRFIHNSMSAVFTIVLFLMALTGIIMYIYPLIRKNK